MQRKLAQDILKRFLYTQNRTLVTGPVQCAALKLPGSQKPTLPNLEIRDNPTAKGQIKKRAFERFFDYLSNYDKILKKILPGPAVKAIELFTSGTKLLFSDMKDFAWTNHVLTSTTNWEKACTTLSRKQLELYLHLPSDLMRAAPVLVVSALPFAQNVVFPLALMFPKRLLSSHFWNEKQWHEVQEDWQKSRQSHYLATFKQFVKVGKVQLAVLESSELRQIFVSLSQGNSPTIENIVALNTVCQSGALSVPKLSLSHARHLIKMHDIAGFAWWWFPRYKLQQHGNLLRQIDFAVNREGVESLNDKDRATACYLRGLNPSELTQEECETYLRQWLQVSSRTDSRSISLLLHLPLLLGLNQKGQFWKFH